MTIHPLPKEIYDRAITSGVAFISLKFSGGSDEGHLDIELLNAEDYEVDNNSLVTDIDNWVWDVYSYSGAGDGNDYGDDITYDLKAMKANHKEWWMSRHDGEIYQEPFSIEAPEVEETAPAATDEYPLTATAEAKIQMIRDELASTNNPERVSALLTELEAILTK
jgi:hypothetical protein